jgi:hydroxyacylglutathione hydrolase
MKRNARRMLLIVGLLFVLFISLLGIRIYRIMSDMKKMTPFETGEIVAGVYAIRDSYVNLYLVKNAGGYIAIDSGIQPEVIQRELKKVNVDASKVSAVFLTHGDSDHVGGLSVFQNAKFFLSNEEEQMIDGRTARFMVFKNKPIPKHDRLDDSQTVEIEGLKVMAILTPGHTPGATCYLVDGRYLFTGDSMRLQDGKADIFGRAINMDSAAQFQSLRKLAKLRGVEYIFTGHFGYTASFDRAFGSFKE